MRCLNDGRRCLFRSYWFWLHRCFCRFLRPELWSGLLLQDIFKITQFSLQCGKTLPGVPCYEGQQQEENEVANAEKAEENAGLLEADRR